MSVTPEHILVIKPTKGWVSLGIGELVQYRELIGFLAWRDIAARYRQTLAGIGWAIAQPLFMMVVCSLVFGRVAKLPSDGLPYPLFSYAALLPWQFVTQACTGAAGSLLASANMLTKVYFPRLIIPVASVLPPLIDFSIAFLVLVGIMLYFGLWPSWRLLFLLPCLLLAFTIALGVGLWLSALSIEYRDVRHLIPFFIQGWMFVSPVVYSSRMVPGEWKLIYSVNPLVGVIDGFRWSLLDKQNPPESLLVSCLVAVSILVSGAFYFRRMERTFADVI